MSRKKRVSLQLPRLLAAQTLFRSFPFVTGSDQIISVFPEIRSTVLILRIRSAPPLSQTFLNERNDHQTKSRIPLATLQKRKQIKKGARYDVTISPRLSRFDRPGARGGRGSRRH